jgi:hypothetical protein
MFNIAMSDKDYLISVDIGATSSDLCVSRCRSGKVDIFRSELYGGNQITYTLMNIMKIYNQDDVLISHKCFNPSFLFSCVNSLKESWSIDAFKLFEKQYSSDSNFHWAQGMLINHCLLMYFLDLDTTKLPNIHGFFYKKRLSNSNLIPNLFSMFYYHMQKVCNKRSKNS